jgi:hypothetical protein
MKIRLIICAAVAAAGLTGVAFAGDGAKLLKQPATFPISISQGGSYRLKSNITVPDANTTAIRITANDVTLDLNGFTISGPTSCGGHPLTCTPTGTGVGIDASGSENVTIVNGTVRGMGGNGVIVTDGRAERVTATNNGGSGLEFGAGVATGCTVRLNGVQGIGFGGTEGLVTGCRVEQNGSAGVAGNGAAIGNIVSFNGQTEVGGVGGAGIEMNAGVIMGNTVMSNIGFGIVSNGVVVNNHVLLSQDIGILVGDGTVVGNTANVNGADGIQLNGMGGVVVNNASFNNTALGLNLPASAGYANDATYRNTGGTVTGGLQMGTNVCNGSTTCP